MSYIPEEMRAEWTRINGNLGDLCRKRGRPVDARNRRVISSLLRPLPPRIYVVISLTVPRRYCKDINCALLLFVLLSRSLERDLSIDLSLLEPPQRAPSRTSLSRIENHSKS